MLVTRIPTNLIAAGLGAMTLTACSELPQKGPPTEQEIHARDSGVASGSPGRHVFRCDDGKPLIVDFKDQGLTVEFRTAETAPPKFLTAPLQGLQYIGDTETATFSGNRITIEALNRRPVLCEKETIS